MAVWFLGETTAPSTISPNMISSQFLQPPRFLVGDFFVTLVEQLSPPRCEKPLDLFRQPVWNLQPLDDDLSTPGGRDKAASDEHGDEQRGEDAAEHELNV